MTGSWDVLRTPFLAGFGQVAPKDNRRGALSDYLFSHMPKMRGPRRDPAGSGWIL
jgi:hypothetical protein